MHRELNCCLDFALGYFPFSVWSVSYNCLHDTTRNETYCGCYFIAVILTGMKFHFDDKVSFKPYPK